MFIITATGNHGESALISKVWGGKKLYRTVEEAKAAIENWVSMAYAPFYPDWKFAWSEVMHDDEDGQAYDDGFRMTYLLESEWTDGPTPFASVIELDQ